MNEYLEKTCVNLGIKLVFTYNKVTALSAEIRNGTPLLIADMIFKDCPNSVAQSVMSFYTDKNDKNYHERVIKNYLSEQFKSNSTNIKHLDLSFLTKSNENIDMDYNINIDMDSNEINNININDIDINDIDINNIDINDPAFIELDISSIDSKDFMGNTKQYKSNTTLKPLKDDELELNIVVLPPVT